VCLNTWLAHTSSFALYAHIRMPWIVWLLGRCWSGEHLPLGLLAIGVLIVVVIGLPLGTLVLWHRQAGGAQFEAAEESGCESASHKLQQQIFYRGDYELKFFWVRHAGWAVLVLIGIFDEFCEVCICLGSKC
jgi:hypothetical protein